MKRGVTPLTVDLVQKRLDKLNGETVGATATATATTTTKTAKSVVKSPTVSMTDDDDMNEAFPAYSGDTVTS